ncbi:MAG TPA: CCA tRNA nucleotidyltransferase [Gemmatimonadales bacterium]|nr:CCA tRNA nucleotidyltransferase [Gemmatimonadales bacterium]
MTAPRTLAIPDAVLDIARRLEDAGFETWCVGGAVRDNLLGIPNADFDLATAARPADVQRLFRRTVPVGLEHGTVAVLDRDNQQHEVTTFRRDVSTDGRHAVVEFGASVDEDLARRDFTINAIAYHPFRHEWRDPFGGYTDLTRRLIRAVGDPRERFREDYLRILRALRFAARFGFAIDAATWDAARAETPGLAHLSAERVREEWFRGLASAVKPSELAQLWADVGALDLWLPEVASGRGAVATDRGHPGAPGPAGAGAQGEPSVARAFGVLDRFVPRDPVLLTSHLSANPEVTLTRLKCSRAEIERGRRLQALRDEWPDPRSPAAVRRWMARAGASVNDLVAVAVAEETHEGLEAAVAAVRASGAPLQIADLAVSGDDLIAAGIPRGPAIGETLRRLLDRVLDEPALNTREALIAMAREPH